MKKQEFMRALSAALAIAVSMASAPMSVQAAKTRLSVSSATISKGDTLNVDVLGGG